MKSEKQFAVLRIAFGLVWAIDACLKWQPGFMNSFTNQVTMMMSGQPGWIAAWIGWWGTLVAPHALAWALLLAVSETAIAIGLVFGLFTRTAIVGGILLSLLIWAIPEGFGGPYVAGSTDIGTGIIYAFVLVALWLGACWKAYSIDSLLMKRGGKKTEEAIQSQSVQ